jgi:hypothetical protein
MASQQLQYRKGDAAQEKVTTQDPPRSGLVLLKETCNHGRKMTGMTTGRTLASYLHRLLSTI